MSAMLYVSNVSQPADLGAIEDLFITVGDVKARCIECIPESGHRMGFGIFEMSSAQQAADCIERFNGQLIDGRQFAIVSERPKSRPVPKPQKAVRRG